MIYITEFDREVRNKFYISIFVKKLKLQTMRIVSIIEDKMLKANNILLEMTVSEYIKISEPIISNNEYQRRKVENSNTMYSLLSKDLLNCCTMPSIVLAIDGKIEEVLNENTTEEVLKSVFEKRKIIILDGLQRTYTMLSILTKGIEKEKIENLKKHRIRVELYVGLKKIGILYRMLTLNCGQTPMSKRHEIEILYSDYDNAINDNIHFIKQIDNKKCEDLNTYNFDDAIEGFNSFLNADESPIDRIGILATVQNIDKLVNDNYNKDLFKDFIITYNQLTHNIEKITNNWNLDSQNQNLKSYYGKNLIEIFCKSQTISGFGAAVGQLLGDERIENLDCIKAISKTITLDNKESDVMFSLLTILDEIRRNAPKIGNEQRKYFKFLFFNLFDTKSESYLKLNNSITKSYIDYKNENNLR